MKSKKNISLVNTFLAFMLFHSAISIYLTTLANDYGTANIINMVTKSLQIFFILAIFLKKKIGIYGFIVLRALDCISPLILTNDTRSFFWTLLNNLCLMSAFIVFYSEENKSFPENQKG